MDLPLADEIREARRLSEEALDATNYVQQIHVAITSIDLQDRQAGGLDQAALPVPGDELVNRLCERWPQLGDLPSTGPRPTQPFRERLRMRRQQMYAALQFLNPIARDAANRAATLGNLQHEQSHLLEDPKYAADVAELTALNNERNDVQFKLTPLKQRLSVLTPCGTIVWTFIERIDWATADHLPLPGATEWRAALMVRDLVAMIDPIFNQYRLDLPRPMAVYNVPNEPDPARSAELIAEVTRVREELVRLHRSIYAEYLRVAALTAEVQQRYDQLNKQIMERMG